MSKLYAFSILFIALVGFAAYFLGTYTPGVTSEDQTKYNSDLAESIIKEYSGAQRVYPDSRTNFPSINNYSSYTSSGSSGSDGSESNSAATNQTRENTNQDVQNRDINENTKPAIASIEDVTEVVPLSDIPVETQFGNDFELYKSKLNKRVSFLIPANSKVEETGSVTKIKFQIIAPNAKRYVMAYEKVQDGCFDALGSFSIGSGQGIDFRIIQDNKEIILDNDLKALRLHEMYGSYAGSVGFRGNTCIKTAVPTRVEIRASGFGRYDGADAYANFDKIIESLTV